jgi:hypothetical protein
MFKQVLPARRGVFDFFVPEFLATGSIEQSARQDVFGNVNSQHGFSPLNRLLRLAAPLASHRLSVLKIQRGKGKSGTAAGFFIGGQAKKSSHLWEAVTQGQASSAARAPRL